MEPDLTDFEKWLARDYSVRTVTKYTTDLRTYLRDPSIADEPSSLQRAFDYRRAWDRYIEYLREQGRAKPRGVPEPPVPERAPEGGRRRRKQKKAKTSVDPATWRKMVKAVEEDTSPPAYVLAVLMDTAMRVGDVLRVPLAALQEALRRKDGEIVVTVKGNKEIISSTAGAPDAWRDLRDAMVAAGSPENVAAFVSPTGDTNPEAGGAAYTKVRMRLAEIAEACGAPDRVHLHRLRRTVANQALEAGATLEEVQHLLGHSSRSTTEIYTKDMQTKLAVNALQKRKAAK